jgi:hypothetical protein
MTGPFESLDIDGLDEALVCGDGVCAMPLPPSGEGFSEQRAGVVGEGDPVGESQGLG